MSTETSRFTFVRTLKVALVALSLAVGLSAVSIGAASAVTGAAGDGKTVVAKSAQGKMTSKVVGKTSEGDRVVGTFTPAKVIERDGTLYMKGFLKGVIKKAGPDTKFSGVKKFPIESINGTSVSGRGDASRLAACDILNLVLGPLDLNLLGLEIHLKKVVLDIVAVPGAGNLLGNLLCAVAGLLDGGALGGLLSGILGQLSDLLNQILGALNLGV